MTFSSESAGLPGPVARLSGAARAWLGDHSDRARAIRSAGAAFIIRVVSAALAYLTQVLLARWMGSFEFGVYVYVWTWVLLLGGVVDFGLASSSQRLIPEYSGTKQFELLRGFLSGALFDAGLICRCDDRGDPIVQLAPPLICGQEQFDEMEQILRTVLTEAWKRI